MTVIQPGQHSEDTMALNPGSPCPNCAATATGVVDFNQECPTGEHSPGEQGYACTTVEVNHEDGCSKPMNVDA